MKENYLVFYDKMGGNTVTKPKAFSSGFKSLNVTEANEPVVTNLELSFKEALVIQNNPESGMVLAPVMPLKLIKAVSTGEAVVATAPHTWGIDAVGALTSTYTGKGIVCAVLDTGIDKNSPAFAGMQLIEKDFTGSGNGDSHGHGTHCAGSFFGRPVNGNRIGVAQGVQKALIGKVLSDTGGDTQMLIKALDWALENGANVISMSLGIDFPGYVQYLVSQGMPVALATSKALNDYQNTVEFFERYIAYKNAATDAGLQQPFVVVAAAGNESERNGDARFELFVAPPAVCEGVISVAALGEAEPGTYNTAYFSNIGAKISGPGVNVVSAKPGGGLTSMSGTSMATPHVAGCAALWAEKLKAVGWFSTLSLTSSLLTAAQRTNIVGWNIEDHGAGMVKTP